VLEFIFNLYWIPASAGMTSKQKKRHSRENGNPDLRISNTFG
jgi:hypothetical protein